MGCFSYLCSDCDDSIRSDSQSGEHCILFLLKEGKVLEWMQGQYNSYGRIFKESNGGSFEWVTMDWSDIVDLCFGTDESSGIAAYHTECWEHAPLDIEPVVSDNDPNQGWGEGVMDSEEYKHPTKGPVPSHHVVQTDITWVAAGDFPEEDE